MFSLAYQRLSKYQYSTIIPLSLIVVEFGIILVLLDLIAKTAMVHDIGVESYFLLSVNIALCWIVAGVLTSAYQIENLDNSKKILRHALLLSAVYMGLILVLFGIRTESQVHLPVIMGLGVMILVIMTLIRVFMLRFYKVIRHRSSNRENVVIIGNTSRGRELSRYFLTTTSLPQNYVGFFDNFYPTRVEDMPFYLGPLDEVKKYCLDNNVKEIYYALDQQRDYFADLMKFADENFIYLGIIPDVDGMDFGRRVDTVLYNDSRIPVISARKVPLRLIVNWNVKRVFDVVFSAIVLFGLSLTLFPAIALAIKFTSPGPVFFKQLRPGRNNKLFWCYKFRTMRVNNEDQKQATKNDNRITRIGAFLRKTSLDELPQFYNVLIGDMSVVGPRPNLVIHLEEYPKDIKEYSLRHWVTPGITGYAQVSGFRGETKEIYQMQKRVDYDLQYIENWRLSLDLQIIGRTVWNIFKGEENAY